MICRTEHLRQREQELRGQLEELNSIQNRAVQALQAAGTALAGAQQQPAQAQPGTGPSAGPTATAQPGGGQQAGASSTPRAAPPASSTGAAAPSQAPPQPALFSRAPTALNSANAARGLAQVLEGTPAAGGTGPGPITSAMFGSAMQAAMAAAQQVTACLLI